MTSRCELNDFLPNSSSKFYKIALLTQFIFVTLTQFRIRIRSDIPADAQRVAGRALPSLQAFL